MDNDKKSISWEELLDLIATGDNHPDDTNWAIFRYLQQHYKDMGSMIARTLLTAYMKLHTPQPSLINSCMLGMAVKISETYSDFQLPKFLEAWGYDKCLRTEDRQAQVGKDGRKYLALQERVERALQSYRLHHPEMRNEKSTCIVSMYAVAVFEKTKNGRKQRFAKLVSADGTELIADSRQFPCRPYELVGRMFDVLTRTSLKGNERAVEIVISRKKVEDVFSIETGYVEGIDESHGHIHIYDSQSRHFVASKISMYANPAWRNDIIPRSFVKFCPIIANGDHFKSAAIVSIMDKKSGREAFGMYTATLTFVNRIDAYIRYEITSDIKPTTEGEITKEGFASIASLTDEEKSRLDTGNTVRLLLFLKRNKDGVKRNYVAEIILNK